MPAAVWLCSWDGMCCRAEVKFCRNLKLFFKLTLLKSVAELGRETSCSSQFISALRKAPSLVCIFKLFKDSKGLCIYPHLASFYESRIPFPVLSCTCRLCLQSTLHSTSCRVLGRPGALCMFLGCTLYWNSLPL